MVQLSGDRRVGTRFAGYEIESVIGVGGMACVYRALAPDGTPVALKIAKPEFARDETFRCRFEREARIAQTVHNPHVVPVLEAGEFDGALYLVETFIDGTSLERKLKREGTLDLRATVSICAQVADGLEALWAAGMVHRDVKPANILLDRQGMAYITDFGLAKDTQDGPLTRPGQAVGSLNYMAPEQIRGEELTCATDVYALGCVAFECLHGQPPFASFEGLSVLFAHLQTEPPDPSPSRCDPSAEFIQVLKSTLAKDPADRPCSSVAFAQLLSEAAGLSTAGVAVA